MTSEDTQTVAEAFEAAAKKWPTRPFLNVLEETAEAYGISAGEVTYQDAANRVSQTVDRLKDTDYIPGQRVMLLLENRPAFFLWWLALNKLGLSVVPVNPDLRAAELGYMIGHAEPVLAITVAHRIDALRRAALSAGVEMPVMSVDGALPRAPNGRDIARRDGDAEAALLYTSGTTGQPKGCVLTNTYFLDAGRWYASTGGLCALHADGERMITPLPVFHMNAMAYSFMVMVAVGGCLTVLDRFHPRSWWASVRTSKSTCLHYLGVMPSMLMLAETDPRDRDHNVRFGFGAGVDPRLHAAFEERFGFPLVEGWAMTETGAGAVICANRSPRRVGENCLGKAEYPVDVRLKDDHGQEADHGELLVRNAGADPRRGFFAGYFKNAEATEEAWKGGWFHTGDIVRREEDGSLFFVDRKKNVIRRSGENIAAVEVESILMRHPAISGAAVAAVPDEIRGDEVFACVVLKDPPDNPEALAGDIAAWGQQQMAYYKIPGYFSFVKELPLTSTQKLQRAALKAHAADLLKAGKFIDTRAYKKRVKT